MPVLSMYALYADLQRNSGIFDSESAQFTLDYIRTSIYACETLRTKQPVSAHFEHVSVLTAQNIIFISSMATLYLCTCVVTGLSHTVLNHIHFCPSTCMQEIKTCHQIEWVGSQSSNKTTISGLLTVFVSFFINLFGLKGLYWHLNPS